MSGLPEGWETTTLIDLVTFNPKHHPDTDRDQVISFVPMPSVDEHTGTISEQKERALSETWKGFTHFADGDVIFAKITPCMENGKSAIARDLMNGIACGSTEFHVLRPSEGILADYLWRYLRQKSFRIEAAKHMTGAVGQRRVPKPYLEQLEFPLPPLAEQRRIVEKLDQLSARTRAAKDHLAHVQTLATRAKQATLATFIDGQDLSVERMPVGDVISTLDQGWSPKCKSDPVEGDTSWGVIKTTSIQAFSFHAGANKALPSDLKPRPRLAIEAGDVLITRAGPRVRVGVTCYVHEAHTNLMICDKVYRLRVDPSVACPKYLTSVLNSPASLDQLESFKTGGNDSGLNLTQKRFLSLSAPFPPFEQQTKIVRRIEAAFARIDRMVAEATRAAELLERLETQLLAKAFRGELVPQDLADDPASVLLARIREARAKAPKPKRRRKRATT